MDEAVIKMSAVSKRFGTHQVLDHVDLFVPQKSVFAFLGNNGAGKSTAIRLIVGLSSPDAGCIHVLGRNIVKERASILRDIACLVEAPSAYPNLTAREFLKTGCFTRGISWHQHVVNLVALGGAKRLRVPIMNLLKLRTGIRWVSYGNPVLFWLEFVSSILRRLVFVSIR